MFFETDPDALFSTSTRGAIPLHRVTSAQMGKLAEMFGKDVARWAAANGFEGNAGETLPVPDATGKLKRVLCGIGNGVSPLSNGSVARKLPAGRYIFKDGDDVGADQLSWALSGYDFQRYRGTSRSSALLAGKRDNDAKRIAEGVFITRDLINTPANDMGPEALEAATRKLARHHKAKVRVVKGDKLLSDNFPMIHAVGRASVQAPRLLDLTWGKAKDPRITLVGKGVTFDTGGLNIKPGSSMALMKKDMGGAANVLGLAHMIMSAKLQVRLRVIIGAVENAISGNAFRPGDVLQSRKGITVEIGNTDAEGRLVLGDCLALGDEESPVLMIDIATLTGAARVALGPDLAPFYTHDDDFAAKLEGSAQTVQDPVWRMPLWQPYHKLMTSKVADVNHINTSGTGFAGSITAALFLSRFVEKARCWAHFDVFGWVPSAKPWAPVGGEAQAVRALYDMLVKQYPR
ncbi:MAG: leucyl aminopeptidase family protein [Ahrensia sp.]|nr:leucyl aminopeptidase family protein [Ahrensia sp.]